MPRPLPPPALGASRCPAAAPVRASFTARLPDPPAPEPRPATRPLLPWALPQACPWDRPLYRLAPPQNKSPQTQKLRAAHVYYHSDPMGQGSRLGVAGPLLRSPKVAIQVWAGTTSQRRPGALVQAHRAVCGFRFLAATEPAALRLRDQERTDTPSCLHVSLMRPGPPKMLSL